jgi:hypothetical protein
LANGVDKALAANGIKHHQLRSHSVTANKFRELALELPETIEQQHMSHPDFRVGGKIFATLGPGERLGMVKLTPEQQASFMEAEPSVFAPATGAWGRNGATIIQLKPARVGSVRPALIAAWRNAAPTKLVSEFDSSDCGD